MDNKTLYLVDVSSLFFRAYYAVSSHLSSPKGLPTNALYGLLSMTLKFIQEHKAEHIVYCFDHEKPSFRSKIYPEYKAHRGETPEDLKVQIPYIKKLVSALSIPSLEQEGYEADDLIGSLVTEGKNQGFTKVVIVSGDKDFAQLVSPVVSLYDPMKDKSYDAEGVQKKWGVLPKQMQDYLALVGDSSDNIPGVFGIGPKGARKLLQEYSDLESIYKNIDHIPKKTAEKLQKSQKQAFLSKKLVCIVTDLKLTSSLSFKRKEFEKQSLKALLKELNFKSFEKKLFGASSSVGKGAIAPSKAGAGQKIKKLSSNLKLLSFSFEELKNLIQPYSKVWCFSIGEKYFLSCKNKVIDLENHSLKKLGSLFSERRILWCGYDLKKIWKDFACARPRPFYCAMVGAYLAESGPPMGFERLCLKYLAEEVTDLLQPGEIYQLHKRLKKELEKHLQRLNMLLLYEQIELPLITVLYEMEEKGIVVDSAQLKKQAKEVNFKIQETEKAIFQQTSQKFNISSPKQLADLLFIRLKLKPVRKTKTGYSTDMDVLNKLKNQHPVIPLILQHRELFKLKTTYIEALLPLIKKNTGRVHTHFRQALTSTGRLSSVNPNLQNIPIKTDRGRKIRKAFIAPPGKKLVSADYSQIELRILAHITEDPALCRAFNEDQDIHTATASEIYSVSIDKVTARLRRSAKAINFGLIYGQGAYTLSESLGLSVSEADEIIKNYFARFKRVKEYMDSTVKTARKQGFVQTLFGRKRFIREISASRFQSRKWSERAAINAPIQGTAGDLMKKVMIDLRNSLYSPILLQIHDELLFECDGQYQEEEIQKIKQIMESTVQWKVPLKVHIHVGQDWYTAEKSSGVIHTAKPSVQPSS